MQASPTDRLTPHEERILTLRAAGKTAVEIDQQLGYSMGGTTTAMSRAAKRLGKRTQYELMAWWLRSAAGGRSEVPKGSAS